MRLKQKVTLCVRLPSTAHTLRRAAPAACSGSHNVSFCSTGGTWQRPRCHSKGRQPPQTVSATRPRPPLPFNRGPGCGASTPCRGGRAASGSPWCAYAQQKKQTSRIQTAPNPIHTRRRKRNGVLSGAALSRSGLAPCCPGKSLRSNRRPGLRRLTVGLRSGRHRARKPVTLPADRCRPGVAELRALCLSEAGRGGASESKVFLAGECPILTGNNPYSPVFTRLNESGIFFPMGPPRWRVAHRAASYSLNLIHGNQTQPTGIRSLAWKIDIHGKPHFRCAECAKRHETGAFAPDLCPAVPLILTSCRMSEAVHSLSPPKTAGYVRSPPSAIASIGMRLKGRNQDKTFCFSMNGSITSAILCCCRFGNCDAASNNCHILPDGVFFAVTGSAPNRESKDTPRIAAMRFICSGVKATERRSQWATALCVTPIASASSP